MQASGFKVSSACVSGPTLFQPTDSVPFPCAHEGDRRQQEGGSQQLEGDGRRLEGD